MSDEQVKEIEKLLQGYFKKEQAVLAKIREREERLRMLLNEGGDIKEVKKLVKDIHCQRGEILAEELETARKIDELLNDEQKKRWREIRRGGR